MKNHRIVLILVLCLTLCLSLWGCSSRGPSDIGNETVPSVEEGLVSTVTAGGLATVYLPPNLAVVSDDSYSKLGWQIAARNDDLLVLGAREDKALFAESSVSFPESLEDYVAFLNETNAFENPIALQDNGLYATSYVGELAGNEMYIYVFAAQGQDTYWMVHLACPASQQAKYEAIFPHWAELMELK